ncbi:MAG: N-acetylglucosamine-6-phosphate deacetylase [Bacteroidetes bacterium]|nr:N-acetylglucosamine-6-phosphate deacetylase [Bacteroidota bacterium]
MVSVLKNAKFYFEGNWITGKNLLFENGIITEFSGEENLASDSILIDAEGSRIVPGFIDLQVYGGGGYLFSATPSNEALQSIAESLIETGTTSFMITLATNSFAVYDQAIEVMKRNTNPAVLGLHLEGPYINPAKRGAHLMEFIQKGNEDQLKKMLDKADGVVKMMTLAPEVCSDAILKILTEYEIVLSAGHSSATYAQANEGFEKGITTVTHLFNAMSSIHHRDTGLPGATFLNDQVYASIICDGIHVDFPTVELAYRLMKDRLFLITDAVESCNTGPYQHVKQKNYFSLPDGTLSGSALTMIAAIKNCVENTSIPVEEAIAMATTIPSKVIGNTHIGNLNKGSEANFLLLNNDLTLKSIFLNGEKYTGNKK